MRTVLFDSLEDGTFNQDNQGPLNVPLFWWAQWREDPKEGVLDRPEIDYENREEGDRGVRTGQHGTKIAHSFATFWTSLRRQVPGVEAGRVVSAEAWTSFFTESPGSSNTGGMNMNIGIDPYGGTDMESSSVVWGDWIGEDGMPDWDGSEWKRLYVETEARRSTVTVFLLGMCRWQVKTNAVFFDDIKVQTEGTEVSGTDLVLRANLKEAIEGIEVHLRNLKETL